MEELRSFRRTGDIGQANELLKELEKHNIAGKINEIGSSLDASFGATEITREFEVALKPSDFERANNILQNNALSDLSQVDPGHYLFEFTNEELYDILLKPDEWNELDYNLTIKILKDRGQSVDEDLLLSLKKQRLEDLSKPEESNFGWILFGYISAALGGILGLFLGWHIWKSTKTLPDGKIVYTYNQKDRSHGQIIFYLGVFIFPIALIISIMSNS